MEDFKFPGTLFVNILSPPVSFNLFSNIFMRELESKSSKNMVKVA